LENNIFRSRRSIFPVQFDSQPVKDEIIWEILEDANNAPSHKHTEPWRFRVYTGETLKNLGEKLAHLYKSTTDSSAFKQLKYDKIKKKALLSSHAIAIGMKRHPESGLPEWEEVAAVACSVQSIYLSCTMRGLGCYWSSPGFLCNNGAEIGFEEGVRSLGLVYIGVAKKDLVFNVKKGSVREKTTWVSEIK